MLRAMLARFDDWRLERAIGRARRDLIRAESRDEQRAAWRCLRALIAARSAAQIARMERAKGLAPRNRGDATSGQIHE